MAVWIAIALTMHCHHRTDGNRVLLQAGRSGAGRGRQRNFPNLAVRSHDLHGAVRAGELDSLGDRAGHGGDFIDISAPAVMCKGRNGGWHGNGGGEHECVQAHDILLSWMGGFCRNPWVREVEIFRIGIRPVEACSPSDWLSLPNCGRVCRIAVESTAKCRTCLGQKCCGLIVRFRRMAEETQRIEAVRRTTSRRSDQLDYSASTPNRAA